MRGVPVMRGGGEEWGWFAHRSLWWFPALESLHPSGWNQTKVCFWGAPALMV